MVFAVSVFPHDPTQHRAAFCVDTVPTRHRGRLPSLELATQPALVGLVLPTATIVTAVSQAFPFMFTLHLLTLRLDKHRFTIFLVCTTFVAV